MRTRFVLRGTPTPDMATHSFPYRILANPERLAALRATSLMHSPPEAAFDRLAGLAARILGTPVGLVNLLDDRHQFTKSCFAPVSWPAQRETPLPDSFCKYAVISNEPLVIGDTLLDPRVSSSPVVTDVGVRSYLGIPLVTTDGFTLGTLCVADFKPRQWTDEAVQVLDELAASVVAEIELRQALRTARAKTDEAAEERAARLAVARAQQELAESEERFRLLVDGVRDYGIFMLSTEGRIISWNTGAERIKGYSAEEVLGRHFSTFYTQPDIDRRFPDYELVQATEHGRFETEGWRVRKDGTQFWANVVITAVRRKGELIGFAKVTRDLTERKRAEEEREALLVREQAARIEAERASRAKSEFLATMSHELRTPLNAIIGYTDLALMGVPETLPEATRPQVERIALSANHLLQLIEEILSFYRLETSRETVSAAPVQLPRLVDELQAVVEPLASAQGLRFRAELPGEPVPLVTDPRKLRQVLLNLLDNAIKYTREGEITLRIGAEPGGARFQVADTGIGIAPEHLERVFEPFWQVEQSLTRQVGGTGLGLAVARRTAELLGGSLTVESEPRRGTTFTLLLPEHPPE